MTNSVHPPDPHANLRRLIMRYHYAAAETEVRRKLLGEIIDEAVRVDREMREREAGK